MDRKLYKRHMQDILFNYANLTVRAASVFDVVFNTSETAGILAQPEVGGVRLGKSVVVNLLAHTTYSSD
jgi:tRNA uridine 5-carboxymethylaminomethyl modification enzyme